MDVVQIDSLAVKSCGRADHFTKQSSWDALVIWQMSAVCKRHVGFFIRQFPYCITAAEHVSYNWQHLILINLFSQFLPESSICQMHMLDYNHPHYVAFSYSESTGY